MNNSFISLQLPSDLWMKRLFITLIGVISFMFFGCASVTYQAKEKVKVEIEKPITIRVVVEKDIQAMDIVSDNALLKIEGNSIVLPSNSKILVGNGYIILNDKKYPAPISIESSQRLIINDKGYIGDISIHDNMLINILPLEEYLKGVLSSEIKDEWPFEALKTQAVVSRTYALYKMMENKDKPYDIDNTEMNQKFEYNGENENINRAVSTTIGVIILYENKPIEAIFHSSSGGITENSGDIFQKELPYLKSIPDPYSLKNGEFYWNFKLSEREIKAQIGGVLNPQFRSLSIQNIRVYRRTDSGRAGEFMLTFGKNQNQIIKGNMLRLALDPKAFKSLLIEDIRKDRVNGEYFFTFSGRGYGHGVGLSQWGAKAMAEQGFTFGDIIKYYFRGTQIGNYNSIILS